MTTILSGVVPDDDLSAARIAVRDTSNAMSQKKEMIAVCLIFYAHGFVFGTNENRSHIGLSQVIRSMLYPLVKNIRFYAYPLEYVMQTRATP